MIQTKCHITYQKFIKQKIIINWYQNKINNQVLISISNKLVNKNKKC